MKNKKMINNEILWYITEVTLEWEAEQVLGRELTPIEFHRFIHTLRRVDKSVFKAIDEHIISCTNNTSGQWNKVDDAYSKYQQKRKGGEKNDEEE